MNKLFEEQQSKNEVVTEEILGELSQKNYTNGDPIKVGDQVLYAFLEGEPYDDPEIPNGQYLPLTLIRLNEEQISQYEFKPEAEFLPIPVLKPKK